MAKKMYTNEEIALIVDSEGLGYAIQCYVSGDSFKDKELGKMWNECAELMDKIEECLEMDEG